MDYIKRILLNKELRNKIIYILLILLVYRIFAHIPIPGPSPDAIKEFLSSVYSGNSVLNFMDVFSGGGISRFSIAMMGVGPYITASIMIQLLTTVIPKLESLSKEGEQGRHKLNQYSRMISIPVSFIEGFAMIKFLQSSGSSSGSGLLSNLSIGQWFLMLLTISAGSVFLMWLGELITEKGIGNGVSMIIFAGIVSRGPQIVGQSFQNIFVGGFNSGEFFKFIGFLGLALIVVAIIVVITEAQRKIPISYAKKVRGSKLYGGIDTFLPMKLNMSGVIPIIFAGAFMNIPAMIGFLSSAETKWVANTASFIQSTFAQNTWPYVILLLLLVFAFTFFSTFLYFKPKDVSENIQKQGGFIPGFRPGTQTEAYLRFLINRVTLWGAIFLSLIAALPSMISIYSPGTQMAVGGTGLLIVVGVAIEIRNQIEAQMIVRSYEEF